ncbi:RNA polymerase sigma-70 factor, ECF subfamily [Pseudarthrobacter enclensis]|uniref:RNA polymerase sigma factor n=1 Tax=Pseudarthrobacter enclensis TaxID=993070 RepID=UPI0008159129|nr:RNA polymerase sigma factor [Pseudarthrobacter enclensis]SCC14625.1 RNA polymerase sigma-70 factor, ECF subfamily [Pseudarthrobacter enclensis]
MEKLGESDAVLWSRCVGDDPEALGQLFDRYADAVFRYCLSRTASWQDAEDLVSVTFLEAWRKRRNLALERESLLPWLLGVATNAMRNRSRSRRRHDQFLARLPHSPVEPDHATATAERMDAEQQVRDLLAAATSLTDGERDALMLCAVHGYSYQDAAEALQVRLGTIRSRVNRAKKKLQAAAPTGLGQAALETFEESRQS